MAMSGDATNWAHFYALGSHPSSTSPMFGHGPAESTVVTTAAASSSTPAAGAGAGGGCGPQMGRAGKTARRRSRASRRAPTTLLNTDTANFRAMVQQFTGIPSGPQAHLPAGGGQNVGPVINFGQVFSDPARPAPNVVSFGHMQQQQQQQPYMDHQFHYSRPVFTQDLYNNNNNNNNNNSNNSNNNNNTSGKNDHDIYLHGYGGSVSSSNSHAEISEGFIFDGVHDHMMLPKTTTSTNSRVDGYFS